MIPWRKPWRPLGAPLKRRASSGAPLTLFALAVGDVGKACVPKPGVARPRQEGIAILKIEVGKSSGDGGMVMGIWMMHAICGDLFFAGAWGKKNFRDVRDLPACLSVSDGALE